MFLDLFNLVLATTCYAFNSRFYQQINGVSIGGPVSSTTAEVYRQAHEQMQYLQHCTLQKFGNDLLMAFIPFISVRTWKTFFIRLTIRFNMEK